MIKKCEYCKKKFIPRTAKIKDLTLSFMVSQCNCKEVEEKKEQIQLLYKDSLIDEYFLINDFPVVDKIMIPLKNNIEWVQKGKQIIVFGNPGNYKTGQVTDVCKMLMQNFIKVKYYDSSDIPGIGMNDKKQFELIKRTNVLILDNFGKDKIERAGGIIFRLIDFRIHNYLSTILITNYDKLDYNELFSPEFVSRLNGFDKIPIDSEKDKRENIKYER